MSDNTCSGGVELDGNKPCRVCGATPRDQCRREGRWVSRMIEEHELLRSALKRLDALINKDNDQAKELIQSTLEATK